MQLIVLPGYNDLFGKPKESYEELLSRTPTDLVLRLIISLNNELNTDESFLEKQRRFLCGVPHSSS